MEKTARLTLIEKFWKSKKRGQRWESITWDPFHREGDCGGLASPDKIHMHLFKGDGYVFWTPGIYQVEMMEEFSWEWALLDLLNVWYSMPENWDTPIFINEEAMAICIPHLDPLRFADLFTGPNSELLGMEEWRQAQEEWQRELSARRESRSTNLLPHPIFPQSAGTIGYFGEREIA